MKKMICQINTHANLLQFKTRNLQAYTLSQKYNQTKRLNEKHTHTIQSTNYIGTRKLNMNSHRKKKKKKEKINKKSKLEKKEQNPQRKNRKI
jgi:hypothetical protein